jgi:tRNA wybutosine-synthesizing protein 1
MPKISSELKKLLENQHYSFIGEHSAIKICEWTKKSLLDKGFCYKEQFYGIKSHRCCQMTPSIGYCTNKCIFCWRPIEYTEGTSMKGKVDQPKQLIENAIIAQRKQLIGFKGNKNVNLKKLEEALHPNQFAISLSGEPTLYPKLGELIKEIKKIKATSFVVSNGMHPEALKKLKPLPTNLYISLDATNEEVFRKVNRSTLKDGWKRLNKSLEVMSKMKATTVLRITAVKGLNMLYPEQYAKLIEKANPEFIEVKSYMWVGYSQQRLEIKNMPLHDEIKKFSEEIVKHLNGYKIKDEKKESRVVLIAKK